MQAACKGSKRKYPGKIVRDNGDGTYDVKFDDGDRDRAVPKRSIEKDRRGDSGSSGSESGYSSSGSQDSDDKKKRRKRR